MTWANLSAAIDLAAFLGADALTWAERAVAFAIGMVGVIMIDAGFRWGR